MSVNPSPPARDHILRAILSTLVAMSCFSVLNAMSKTLSAYFPMMEIIWARYFFAFVFMLVLFLPSSGRALFSIRRLDTQVVRGLLLFLFVVSLFPRPRPSAAGDGGIDLPVEPDHRDGAVAA